jgi:putative hydrolase of the HAD superfamily
MAQISTVIWDVGGVLLTNGWDRTQRDAVLDHFGVAREPFETIHAELNDSWERGLITVEEYLEKTVFREPRSFTQREFLAKMKEQSALLPNTAMEILKQVAATDDLAVTMLNNESRELNNYRLEKFGLFEYFDSFISSCYVRLRKPQLEIYKLALDLLQRDADETVFIDDRPGNIEAAKKLGIHGIVHATAAETAGELSRLGISVVT